MTSSPNYRPPSEIDVWDAENVFYLKSPKSRLGKLLSHYEIYKSVIGVPGAVVECGVYKGASLIQFATFRALLENDDARAIYGFDAFGMFPTADVAGGADQAFIKRFEEAGGAGITEQGLMSAMNEKGLRNVSLIAGDVRNTIPSFLDRVPHVRIALLHLDMDVYEPTKYAIEAFLPHMTPGGLIVFDDYNAVEGATRAADELVLEHGLTLQKSAYYNVPACVTIGGNPSLVIRKSTAANSDIAAR
ncbi:MAG: class I SAM-dependent methyltransferase [Gemmatimonadaceae bacterium]|nr:class I SAM-dependent methyltransferase [Gemmatimonadaceae bacterium]